MNDLIPLSSLSDGERAEIAALYTSEAETERLSQLGIHIGTEIAVRMHGSSGSPVAFTVHGAVIALRRQTCQQILVQPVSRRKTYLLTGNPNVGKSTVFNALTGLKQHTGNWCGKTVEGAEGTFSYKGAPIRLIDTPGTYSVYDGAAEEAVTGKIIAETPHDCVICVCDATCLERGLILVLELLQTESRAVLCLNLMDEAKQKHISVDIKQLSALLGIPVVGVTAKRKHTLLPLLEAADKQSRSAADAQKNTESKEKLTVQALEICKKCVTMPPNAHRRDERLDRLFSGSQLRYPIMLMMLLAVFWLTMTGANIPSELLSRLFSLICTGLHSAADQVSCPVWLSGAVIDGMLRGTGWVISVMLPPMAIFFPLFTLLEDIGILPRIAFNLDHCCAKCRACGKQALTMTMGFGCNAVGVTECRIIESKRERLIAILTNALVPCNGRFPALLAVITVFFSGTDSISSLRAAAMMTLLILVSVAVTFCASAFLGKTVLHGQPSSFVLELPPYRKPQIGQIIVRSVLDRTVFVLGRAVMTAAPVSLLIWILANVTVSGQAVLQMLAELLAPFGAVIGLDGVLLLAFLLGLPANEIVLPVAVTAYLGASSLTDYGSLESLHTMLTAHGWTSATAVCYLIFTLFHSPCATTLLTVYKETHSKKWTFAAFLLPTAIGILLCGIAAGIFQIAV